MESYHTVTAKLNSKCLNKFKRDIEEQERIIDRLHKTRYSPDVFYTQVFIPKVRKGEGQGVESITKEMYIVYLTVTIFPVCRALESVDPVPLQHINTKF